jgi:hypothetical protein
MLATLPESGGFGQRYSGGALQDFCQEIFRVATGALEVSDYCSAQVIHCRGLA